jgi:hypothetical protein
VRRTGEDNGAHASNGVKCAEMTEELGASALLCSTMLLDAFMSATHIALTVKKEKSEEHCAPFNSYRLSAV